MPEVVEIRELIKRKRWSLKQFANILENRGFFDTYTYLYDLLNVNERNKMIQNATHYFLIGEFLPSQKQRMIFQKLIEQESEETS